MTAAPTDAILVLVSAPTPEQAAALDGSLVEEGLAPCGNVVPGVCSSYRWEGRMLDEPEALIVLKSRTPLFEALRARVVAPHLDQCPEVPMYTQCRTRRRKLNRTTHCILIRPRTLGSNR